MSQLVFDRDRKLARFMVSRITHMEPAAAFAMEAIAIADGDKVLAVAGYSNWSAKHKTLEMTFLALSPRWATRGNIRALLSYPFDQLGARRITLLTPRKNRRARRLITGLGWKLEGTVRRGFEHDDCMVYGLLREEAARWLAPTRERKLNGQEESVAAACS